ncbi:phosphoglycerate kinase [Brevibacterium aurantiacum]|uniref:Phosphoglycerate kinase n=1 Tax=Brevibacterium aurantiacum TaxID=273384 RepID=A0A2A3YWF8_BREAU|nr:phosphoglycerate kinase [Brevibacterium aurantiacum]MDN5549716.1 phosphoglycerate kinase [Brevibacterium sp.]AZT97445.1 phosphoglycerate kinase [Brevibacterium aurantiacum]MDN5606830.1 phosphoglycerate kinase [Brevibacterium sp.]MDN5659156.1 phosphoglycerate kinase [Brevibacterium aurantiacum]MDN5772164.1 phosphoglycerate kinase [Brevibacterium aurantiacum]
MRTYDDPQIFSHRTVLVRSDLNVPMDEGTITDRGRILASAGTIKALAEAGARVIVMSHLGRPKGEPDPQFSLHPLAPELAKAIGRDVAFAADTVGEEARTKAAELADGEVLLLENLRFNPGETSKDDSERQAFAAQLAELADDFVSDGFGVVHRKQASVYDIAALLPHYAGSLVRAEVEVSDRLLNSPQSPFTVVLGGSKVSDKLGVIDNLIDRADNLLIGGGMVFTFLAALGHDIGSSLVEKDRVDDVKGYLERAEAGGANIVLPTDIVMAASFAAEAENWVCPIADLESTPAGAQGLGLDIGPDSAQAYADVISNSTTVFWNGPMGVFEFPAFSAGTKAVASALTNQAGSDSARLTVVGGGDSAAAVRTLGFADDEFGHISTGGGASLEYLEGKTLPGLEALA